MSNPSYKKYGYFNRDGTEFIITRPDTPRPWINYLSNGKYCSLISQTAGGYSFYLDSEVNRITRWAPANYLSDQPGRYIYLRDEETGEFWSGGYQPVKKGIKFNCRHGLGYTVITSEYAKIKCETSFFVPLKEQVEIWLVRLVNQSRRKRNLKVFPFIEWFLGNWFAELSIRNITILLNRGQFDKNRNAIFATKEPWGGKVWPYFGFMGASFKIKGFDTDYESFMGRYRDYSNPIVVERGRCANSTVQGMNMVGVLETNFSLNSGEELEFVVVLGICKSKDEAKQILNKYRDVQKAKEEFEDTKRFWQDAILNNTKVQTPDEEFNRAINIWIKYQIYINNHWGRSATFYHEGGGEFGYRNSAQDAWAMVSLNSEYAKERLIKLAKHQRSTGHPLAGWSLETGAIKREQTPSDFPIWLVLLANAYLKETGGMDILKKQIEFYREREQLHPEIAPLYEHIERAIRFLQDVDSSERGLPLMGSQDWNDAFDQTGIKGKGESVWLGMGLCVALKNMEELARFSKYEKGIPENCRKRYKKMRKTINEVGWDGKWYCYAFNDYGEPIGSKKNTEGKIQLNAQTWAILAGIPDKRKLNKLLSVIDKELSTPYGPVLFKPPYTKYNDKIGRITAFAPGTKENAAIFCHAGAFKVAADLKVGRGNEAYRTFKQLLPTASNKDIEIYKTEPYVFAEYLIGPGNPRYGEGAFSWLTGSADWMYIAATQWMLGIRPDFEGLLIEPCIPSAWKSYKVIRPFRGDIYQITVKNPHNVETGVAEITVDGKKYKSNLIKCFGDGKVHRVEIRMDKKKRY